VPSLLFFPEFSRARSVRCLRDQSVGIAVIFPGFARYKRAKFLWGSIFRLQLPIISAQTYIVIRAKVLAVKPLTPGCRALKIH
jgi:hypothetical protein